MILAEFQQIKLKIDEFTQRAIKDGAMSEEELIKIREKLSQEKIIVGICGQVKTGKTTFINALLFGKNVLPVASTPMTASLCRISYGDSPEVEVEFFTNQEWEQIKESVNSSDNEIAQSAREFIESSKLVQNEIDALLGTRKVIDFSMINDFVGSQGKYTSLVKSLNIKLPEEILKGIEIVDTPGVNDPVISRERRAIEFLQYADVIFHFIYAGRPFDESDMKFFRRIKNSVGKVILVVNKKDEILTVEENIEAVKKRIIEQLESLKKEAIKAKESKFLIDLIESVKNKVVFFSSLWALLGKMSEDEIYMDEDLIFHYERFKDDFPLLKTPEDFLQESGIHELEEALREILNNKFILLKSSANQVLNFYNIKLNNMITTENEKKTEIKALQSDLEEIKKELDSLDKIDREASGYLEEKISRVIDILYMKYETIKQSINQEFTQFKSTLRRVVPEKSFFSFHSTYQKECENIFEIEVSKLLEKVNKIILSFKEVNDYIYKEFDGFFKAVIDLGTELLITKDFFEETVRSFKEQIFSEIFKIDIFGGRVEFKSSGWWILGNKEAREEIISQALEETDNLFDKVVGKVDQNYDKIRGIIYSMRERFKVEISDKLKRPIQEAMLNYHQREEKIKKLNEDLEKLKGLKDEFKRKINSIKQEIELIFSNH